MTISIVNHCSRIVTDSKFLKVIIILMCLTLSLQETYNYKEMEIIDDLPMKMNLEQYLTVLEKVVNFVSQHKNLADLNVCFGIYLVNVNLRRAMQLKGSNLPLRRQVRLERLLKANDEVLEYFSSNVLKFIANKSNAVKSHLGYSIRTNGTRKVPPCVHSRLITVFNLYTNETTWHNNLPIFNMNLLKRTHYYSRKKLEALYFKWNIYLRNVNTVEDTQSQSPDEQDNCLNLLAQNPANENLGNIHCQVRFSCARFVLNGSYYGYGITYRVLFLLAARFSRKCVLTSLREDENLLDKLCAKIYNEAEFNANHDFGLPDLIMEQMSLCTLGGHGQFLRRSWIEELLDYQTAAGCFNLMRSDGNNSAITTDNDAPWQYLIRDNMMFGRSCHTRTTAVAGSMIASAIRFIAENYF